MSEIESFNAAVGGKPEILVLGSIPGVASLNAVQYYAHPRNAFWDICEAVYSIPRSLPYDERLIKLQDSGIALWDVLARARRQGSLDSAIERDSIEVNPIDRLLERFPSIQRILLNGGKAATEFRKRFPDIAENPSLKTFDLPSTSPAYAAMSLDEKTRRWREAFLGSGA